jgi:uncharacterized protein (TIGR04141 family)
MYAEIEHNDDIYLLSGGKWYRITPQFVKDIDKAYNAIPNYVPELPVFNDKEEKDYLKRVKDGEPTRFALMDRKTIAYGGSYSKIEFCDLYTTDHDIIHVKRYGQSSSLSHLFNQGLVSGELFRTDPSFRAKVNGKLPESHQFTKPARTPKLDELQVVFGIITHRSGPLTLPFFSRLNLKHAASRLGAYGFRVAKAKISVDAQLALKKKYRAKRKR